MTPAPGTEPDNRQPVVAFAGEGMVELKVDRARVTLDYGGDAANAATMCARLGGRARLLGRVGADPLGVRLLDFWRTRGVDTSALVVDRDAPTGIYLAQPADGRRGPDRTFTYWRQGSAGSRWSTTDLAGPDVLSGVAAVVVTGITVSVSDACAEATWALVEHAQARGLPVACILNYREALAPDRRRLERLTAAAHIVFASREDLQQAFPDRRTDEIVAQLSGHGRELVITHGAEGAGVSWGRGAVSQRAPAVSARNTVGAGDAFAGAYVWARLGRRLPPADALAWGVAASALSVRSDGCASSYPDTTATLAARQLLPPAHDIGVTEVIGR